MRELWNLYGATETTVWSTLHRVHARDLDAELPIGRPISGTRTYVLDESRRLLPAGVVGELWIGGVGVARGYLDRPELTAERFVVDPFATLVAPRDGVPDLRAADTPRAARMYRTGDLASLDHDGVLHYHGRADRQIKWRGVRIEPGEIEHVLGRHPRVRAALVRATSTREDARLEAFVEASPSLTPRELTSFARRHLPDYMVPTRVVVLESFPLSPSGKVDVAALARLHDPDPRLTSEPAAFDTRSLTASLDTASLDALTTTSLDVLDTTSLDTTSLDDTAHEDAPADDLELYLAALFTELLGVRRVARDDDFFALGGHSLLALRLVRRVREDLDVDLGVARVLEARTVAALATNLRDRRTTPPSIVPLVPSSRPDVAPLFFVCGIHLYRELAERLGPDLPSVGLFAPIEEEVVTALEAGRSPPKLTVCAMADAYVNLLSQHGARGPFRLAGVSFGGVLAFEVARILRARGAEVPLVVLLDSLLPSARRRSWRRWARARWDEGLDLPKVRARVERAWRRVRDVRTGARRASHHDARDDAHDVEALRERLYLDAIAAWERDWQRAPDVTYDGRVLVVRAASRQQDPSDEVAPDLGWRAHVRGPLDVVEVPGDHLGVLRGRSAGLVADEIRRRVAFA